MVENKRSIKKLPKQLFSKKLLALVIDDFALFGSVPFYLFLTLAAYFFNQMQLFSWLVYSFLIAFILILVIKTVHYKDRPQKEEFKIFMEKVIASSFPSTHSMTVTGISILMSISFPSPFVITFFSIVCILVYIQRYITKKHFFIDIVGGILSAIVISIFVIKVF